MVTTSGLEMSPYHPHRRGRDNGAPVPPTWICNPLVGNNAVLLTKLDPGYKASPEIVYAVIV